MIFKRMREHILGKAIRGKLVPQLHEEGNVKQIGNAPTNVPFAIPSTWRWCSLGNLVDYGKAEKISCNDIPSSTWVLELEDIEENTGKILEKKRDVEVKSNKNVFEEGYLLYSKLRPYLNKVVIADECGVCTTELIPINVKSAKAPLLPKYLQFFLMSPDFVDYANRHSHGTKPRLGTNDAKAANIPIPPFEEQNRIVAKIESLFGEIDRAEKAYEELQSLANVLRGQILQKAIQGKLVPQLPEDGVVNQIGDTPAELPFDIPSSWQWLSFSDLLIFENGDRGKNYPAKSKLSKDASSGLPFVSAGNISNGRINSKDLLFLSKEQEAKLKSGHIKANDCLMCIRGSLGKFGFAEKDGGAIASSLVILRIKEQSFLDKDFLSIVLSSPLFSDSLLARKNGTAQPNLGADVLKKFPFPLPPLAEQKRIVAKVEALFEQIDLMTK